MAPRTLISWKQAPLKSAVKLGESKVSGEAGKRTCKTNAAAIAIMLFVSGLALPVSAARARQQAVGQPIELGIIVTGSAEEAESVLKQLKAGFDFGVLAKEKSIDPSAKNGGYMGSMVRSQLRPELRDAAKWQQVRPSLAALFESALSDRADSNQIAKVGST